MDWSPIREGRSVGRLGEDVRPVLHAACLSESKARIQTTVWFQLAKMRLTTSAAVRHLDET